MTKRILALVVVCLGMALMAPSSEAACYEVTKQFFGHYDINGDPFCYWGGSPPQTPVVIGERYRDCWGTVWTWGDTSCEIYPPNYIYEECSCGFAENEQPKDEGLKPASCPAIDPPLVAAD